MVGPRRVLVVAVALTLSGCLIDPIGKARHRVRAGEQAIERRDFAAAQRELAEAEAIAEDDVALKRRIRIARQALERELAKARAVAIPSAGTIATISELWSERERNARSGGTTTTEQQLVTKMRESVSLLLQEQEQLAASGRPWEAFAQVRALPRFQGIDQEVGGDRRITALANQAAQLHLARVAVLTSSPLARRGHQGLAGRYIGGTLSDATALTAPFVPRVDVRGGNAAACASASSELARRLGRTGQGRRVDVELALTDCRESETSQTAPGTATWTEYVLEPKRIEVWRKECSFEPYTTKRENCTMVYDPGPGDRAVCFTETLTTSFYVCKAVSEWVDTMVPRPVERSAPRAITTTTASVAITGTYAIRKEGQPDRRGAIDQAIVRTDTSYPAVGGAPAKDRADRNRPPAMLAEARAAIEQQVAAQIDAALAVDVAVALAAAREAAAAGRIDLEEDALMRAILLGSNDAGALGVRYGTTAIHVREAFATTSFAAFTERLSLSLPPVDVIPELTADERGEIERQLLTGVASPMTLPRWFTFGIAGFGQAERAAPDGAALLGAKGLAVSARAGAMVLGRLQGAGFGPLLVDDAAVRVDAGFALASAADQIGGGTRLVLGADYTAAIGWRTRRFGGVFAGLRATAAYEALEGASLASVPLFARVELPLPTGSVIVEGFGRPLAGTAISGLTLYVTGENRQRGDRSNLFFAVRIERAPYDASATYTNAAFEDLELAFPEVPVTTVGVEIGAGF